jgi:TonB family protein
MLVRLLSVAVTMLMILPVSVSAQGGSTLKTYQWSAVDSSGKHFTEQQFGGRRPPWNDDVIKQVQPDYPYEERAHKHTGPGLFRMEIDLKTGSVREVTVVKSTGYNRLDESAKHALIGWHFRPNSWREVNLPVNFYMRTQLQR